MQEIKIEKGFQSFSVVPAKIDFIDMVNKIKQSIKEFSLYRLNRDPVTKRTNYELEKSFFSIDFRNEKVIFVNTYFKQFINIYSSIFKINVIENKDYKADALLGVNIDSKFIPRDYQEEYIKAIVNNKTPRILVDLYTGYGKSLIASISVVRRKKKFGLLVLATYIEKWIGDLLKYTNLKKEEIYVVQGSDSIRYLSTAPKEELDKYKCYIFSLTTMKRYVDNYLSITEEFKFDISPKDFIRRIKIETIVSDETHQEFHNVFNLTIVLDPKFMLALTATLISNNKNEQKIQNYFLPNNYRLSGIIEYEKYIELYPISYQVTNVKALRAENQFGYNHGKFEDKIKKRKTTLKNYLNLIYFITNGFYIKFRKDGDKCIIFAYTVDMCSIIRDDLRKRIKGLKINKYTAEDDYKVIEESDIIISTLGSAGTALDIPNLITVVQTVMIKSATANIQSLGRLRRLKDKRVRFVYMYANNISKHNNYHKDRLNIFRDRVINIMNLNYTNPV